eukprot:1161135-Pelagomonas_calceolata.AAC.16
MQEEPEEEGLDAVALAARAARARASSSSPSRSPSPESAPAFVSISHPQQQRAASPRPRLWSEPTASDAAAEEEAEKLQGKQAGVVGNSGQGSPRQDGIASEQTGMQGAGADGSSVAMGRQ